MTAEDVMEAMLLVPGGKEGGRTVGEKKGLGSLKRRFSFAFAHDGGARGLGSGWIRARVRRAPRR